MRRDVDEACALAMGYSPCGCGNPDCDLWQPPAHLDKGHSYMPYPLFSTDPAATPLLLAEIERRGLWAEYVQCLSYAIDAPPMSTMSPDMYPAYRVWGIINATPEQHARAFLEVVKG